MMLKMAVLAPMPSASVSSATNVTPGVRASRRMAVANVSEEASESMGRPSVADVPFQVAVASEWNSREPVAEACAAPFARAARGKPRPRCRASRRNAARAAGQQHAQRQPVEQDHALRGSSRLSRAMATAAREPLGFALRQLPAGSA